MLSSMILLLLTDNGKLEMMFSRTRRLLLLLLLLLLWVFMIIKGYVVPLRAQGLLGSRMSECAIKSLDNSSFKMDLYISGRS